MYKIGVVGDKDSILAFKALGIDVYPVTEPDEARITINKMAAEKYNRELIPAVILIPSNQGSLNIGMQRINDNVEKAVGVNIL